MDDREYFAFILDGVQLENESEKRLVLLLIDSAGCNPPEVLQGYSNIKIVFLPANTTSKLQPLDLGIISNFKVHYRRYFLQYVASKNDTATSTSEVTKSINVLTAIRWVALAWREVKASTIQKCFRHAGILSADVICGRREVSLCPCLSSVCCYLLFLFDSNCFVWSFSFSNRSENF